MKLLASKKERRIRYGFFFLIGETRAKRKVSHHANVVLFLLVGKHLQNTLAQKSQHITARQMSFM